MTHPIHEILPNGTQIWTLNGKRHREDGPAYIGVDGEHYWYLDGKWHREDGPAIIHSEGTQYWYLNGKRHREDGPALIYPGGTQYWYLLGIRLKYEEFNEILLQDEYQQSINILKTGNVYGL